jgi:hypothetical protein
MRPVLLGVALCAAISAAAQEVSAPVITTVVVPVVGSIVGVDNVRWRTEVELRNDTRTEANVVVTLPTAPEQPAIALPGIPPGGVVRFADIVGEAFKLDAAISPMVVQTDGRRSVTIRAIIYGVRGTDMLPVQSIPIDYATTFFPTRVLQGLSFSDDFRTNIGIANLGESEASFTLALQRMPGRSVAVTHVTLPGSTLWHSSIQSMFPLITAGDNFSVVIETSAPETHVYASVIENATDAARFVPPSIVGAGAVQTAAANANE